MESGEEGRGLVWKLPEVRWKEVGKIGPGFGLGVGCGVGLGVGLIGGAGFGPGIPGLQLGLGLGAGCGVGLGFGYAVGRGVAYDRTRRYGNVGSGRLAHQYEIGDLIDELVVSTKKLIKATTQEVNKWRRT